MLYKKIFFSAVLVLSGLFIVFLSSQVYAGTAALSWNANTESDVSYYKIYYGTASKSGATPCVNAGYPSSINAGKVTSYTISNLTDGATYYFRISAVDASGNESACSAQVSKIIPAVPVSDTSAPTVPANLSATVVSSSQINLSWSASTDNTGVTGYKIYRNGTQITTTTAAFYSNTGLSAGTSYSYQVSAYDTAGNESAKSASVSAVTSISSPQTGNILIRARGDVAANVWPQMEIWVNGSKIGNASVNTVAYTDFYFNHSGSIQTLDVVFTNDAYYSATGQDRNLYVDYIIVNGTKIEAEASGVIIDKGSGTAAFDGTSTIPGQEGVYWDGALRFTISTLPTSDTSAPAVSISSPSMGATVSGTINVSANASDNTGVAGVQFKLNGVNLETEDTSAPYLISWNTAGVANAPHSLTAVARDVAGNTKTSSAVTVTVSNANVSVDNTTPSQPFDLIATANSSSQITLAWGASTDNVSVSGYRVFRNGSQIATTANTNYIDSNLSAATTYTYQVDAFDANDNHSVKSASRSAVTFVAVCTISSVSNGTVTAYPGCAINCNSGFTLQNNSCVAVSVSSGGGGGGSFYIPPTVSSTITTGTTSNVSNSGSNTNTFSSGYLFKQGLKEGSSGEEVKKLQEFLKISASGSFNTATRQAVQEFQCKYGIICSGTAVTTGYGSVGPITREYLNVISRLGNGNSLVPPQINSSDSENIKKLKDQIRILQQQLVKLLVALIQKI